MGDPIRGFFDGPVRDIDRKDARDISKDVIAVVQLFVNACSIGIPWNPATRNAPGALRPKLNQSFEIQAEPHLWRRSMKDLGGQCDAVDDWDVGNPEFAAGKIN